MLKLLFSTLLLSIILFANSTIQDKLAKCEEVENSKSEQCIEKCENTYYECEAKFIEQVEEKKQN